MDIWRLDFQPGRVRVFNGQPDKERQYEIERVYRGRIQQGV